MSIELTTYYGNTKLPRGIRLNNPLLVKRSNQAWPGKIEQSKDRSFEAFEYYWQGIHAGARIIHKYYIEGASTLEKLIYRYARTGTELTPYIQAVSTGTGIRPREKFYFNRDVMYLIISEMARYELKGRNPMIHPDIFAFVWIKLY